FFSSRRRHTRWPRDWSSDVCSSDLSDGSAKVGTSGAGSACRTRGRNTASNHTGRYFLPDGRVPPTVFPGNRLLGSIWPGVGKYQIGRASCRERGEKTEGERVLMRTE